MTIEIEGLADVITAMEVAAWIGGMAFMLIAGLAYTLAGVHLNRPILWSGLLMFAAYAALQLFPSPCIWTISGIAIGLSLVWAGIAARRTRRPGASQ